MRNQTKPLYNGSMAVFYMVCRFAWKLYMKYQPRFAKFSKKYTKELGEAALQKIDAAQAMPDVTQRRGSTKQQGQELDESSKVALLMWKTLRRYTMKVFAKPFQAAAIEQAGGAHFAKARQGSYSELTELMSAGLIYLTANTELLTEKGMMPDNFAADYAEAKTVYDTEHTDYGDAKGEATDGTTDKIVANNAIYADVQELFGDAQMVFENEKAVAAQFTYAAVKRLVTKDLSGIHFTVLNPATKKPVATAVVATDESAESYAVNERGVLNLRLKTGIHSVTVSAPGFAAWTGVVNVDAGVMHRVYLELVKVVIAAEHEAAHETGDEVVSVDLKAMNNLNG